ncbi:MAG: hypothetical protein GY705_23770 [Bacteroidetes bacterium]|nr:hypothetical protein [Bacteroidota bacterium]
MVAYKFDVKISEDGIIKIPLKSHLLGKEVEIIIVPKQKVEQKEITAMEFVNKWAGFLNSKDADKSKFEYLSRKYQ